MSSSTSVRQERRRRPKDRKAQIARASAEAFSELGYHGVSMEDIAGRVGVTAASLYRHYAGKYALFQAAVLGMGKNMVDITAFLDDSDAEPEAMWDRAVSALIESALKNRNSGGLYRWEVRFLDAADQQFLDEQITVVNRRLQRPIELLRPELPSRHRTILASAVLSVIGSITDHHARLATDRIHATLARIARDIRDMELPPAAPRGVAPRRRAVGAAAGEYEQILQSAMLLFNERGFRDTSMEDIAAAVDMSTTGIYRFFLSKGAILAALFRRGADRVSGDVAEVLASADDPRESVIGLVDSYVRRSIASPELAFVYYAERANVPAEDQAAIHSMQRATVEAWSSQVAAAHPELAADEARFAVQGGYALAVDVGRLLRHEDPESAIAILRRLMLTTLLGLNTGPRSL
ncbi:MAG: TetR/AcrR family transcriptional regulator [Mycobacterium sp.]